MFSLQLQSSPRGGRLALVLATVLAVHGPRELAGEVLVTEIMASNRGSVVDEDGDFSDWFEVHNNGTAAESLEGMYATDDPLDLPKWRFPAVSLAPGEFLIVFASEKNRRNAGGELHTNFRLAAGGEYFALVEPDGVTIAFQYSPQYPNQVPDVSYGLAQDFEEIDLVLPGATCRTFVPSGSLPAGWANRVFDDAAWTLGPTGVGFDAGTDYEGQIGTDLDSSMQGQNAAALVRIPFSAISPGTLDSLALLMKYDDGFVAYLNGQEVARRNAPAILSWNSSATAEHGQPSIAIMSQDFDSSGTAYVLDAWGTNSPPSVQSGGPTGQYLQLMPDNVGSLNNTIGFDTVSGATGGVFASFDYRMPVSGDADGFAFALIETATHGDGGPPPHEGFVWERPVIPDAFAVGFDIWPAGSENSVSINWNGVETRSEFVEEFELHNGVFNRVEITIVQEGTDSLVTITITPDYHGNRGAPVSVVTRHRIPGMTLGESRVAFGGRTGGAFTSVDLDNIRVEFTPGSRALEYEAFDLTERIPLLEDGDNILAIQGLNVSAGDDDFLVLPELFAIRSGDIDPSARRYFPEPTPGWFNSEGLAGMAPAPISSHDGGAFEGSLSLILGAPSPEATVRYTISASSAWLEPGEASTPYTGPIPIADTVVVKARSFEPGLLPSPTVTRAFIRVDSSTMNFSSNLPIVVVNTFGSGIGSGGYTPAHLHVVDVDTLGRARLSNPPDFSGTAALKVRGSSTAGREKASYNVEVRDEIGEDRDVSLLGLPEESDWVLYGPYNFDRALIRNAFIYDLSNQIGQYAVRSRFVEVYRNTGTGDVTSSHYFGVYVLMEKIKRGPDRVDVERLTPGDNALPELAGGYMLKIDRLDPGDSGIGAGGQTLGLVYPKEREITTPQRDYIRNYINDFVNVLNSPGFTDPELGYAAWMDSAAWVDHHILNVLAMNVDALRLSTYMFKPRQGKLTMGPVWDFDRSMESYDGRDDNPSTWNGSSGTRFFEYPWWSRLFQDPDFWQAWRDRWHELRQDEFSAQNITATIDRMAGELTEAQARNFQRWNLGLRSGGWQGEVDHMKDWLLTRLEWIDSQFPAVPALSQGSSFITPGLEIFLSVPAGTVHYTLDGSDPRLPGGAVSPSALEYGSGGRTTLLSPATHSTVQVLVPTATSNLATGWTLREFVPGPEWTTGTTGIGVGYEEGSGYEPYIDVDVGADMIDGNPSVYIRVEFDVEDPSSFAFLDLGMMYDDGFAAYLNGTPVASSNAPVDLDWNSAATAQHADGAALSFERFNITASIGALVPGTNVLAIHGLNTGPTSSDLLIVPEIEATGTFTGGGAIAVEDFTRLRARTRLGNDWSALAEATYVLDDAADLRITELMYHPPDPPPGTPFSDEDFEFVELQNIGASFLDLRGVRLTDGVVFDFTDGAVVSLAPGDLVVVVKNLAAFETVYDTSGILVAGEYTGNLENQGEPVRLENGAGETLLLLRYEDFWYPDTDGGGFSLVAVDLEATGDAWSQPETWQSSDFPLGSPGEGESFSGGRQLPGDADQNSRVDIGDAITLLFQIFRSSQTTPPCEGASVSEGGNVPLLDYNGDMQVDISDPIHLLTYLFLHGNPHVLGTRCVRIEGCPTACLR